MGKIHLCFVWHMHQPFYKDLVTGEYHLPWTRLHALKDYYGMVKVLEDFPDVHQTFNLVPSMIVQIEEYAAGKAADPFLDSAVKAELSPAEQLFVLKYFFQANAGRMIYRYPRYGELYDAFQKAGGDPLRARALFGPQDFRDLQVLSQLAWFDEEFQEHDPEVRELIAKQRGYSLEDQAAMARKQREILAKVVPVYREFAARGQIEISTTPFYHPILPLLCDSNIAAVSHPHVALPTRFQYPGDAQHQLKTARDFFERAFGRAPVGLWPSEGSVSDETLALAAEVGFQWAASDNGVLSQTIHKTAGAEQTYRSYRWRQRERELRLIFRDHFLSDQVGFVYSKMGAVEAADDFLGSIRANARPMTQDGDVLVPIILDGENAWEYYYQNGRPFLRELYRRISEAPDLDALTVSEALKIDAARPLDHIFPGSWINANFDVWIGSQEDNQAWEYLLRARRTFDDASASVSEDARRLAFEELLIAEGSDWCWWYGPEHQSENRAEFDALYRQHLRNIYLALGVKPPEELSRPILMTTRAAYSHQPPMNPIQPTIDGEVTSYFEWMGAGHYRSDSRSGAMHGSRNAARELLYGADSSNFYVRLDFDGAPPFNGVELRTRETTIPLSNNPLVDQAQRTIFEARVPFQLLEAADHQPLSFQIALLQNGAVLEQIPPEGWIEFVNPGA